PPELKISALRAYGAASHFTGETALAPALFEEAFQLPCTSGDRKTMAIVLHRRGITALMGAETSRARTLLEESLELCREVGFAKGEAQAIGSLGELEVAA